ncbi:MAG: diaminopimelate epimerase [Cyanobacteria bacterium REEB459]|nr:diaminopimelate epimerase [Cyanobacteria bacterium REEB459]
MEFSKYQGLGNDFILIDNRHHPHPRLTPQQAVVWCDRHFGIGADGVIFALPGNPGSDYTMRIYNADGSEPEMCGNGIRCLARYLRKLEAGTDRPPETPQSYRIHTLAGIIAPTLQPNGLVTVDMGSPYLLAAEIPTTLVRGQDAAVDVTLTVAEQDWQVTCVSMGNPHCVTFVADLDTLPLAVLGPAFEHHGAFPQRINAEFIQVLAPDHLKMRVWERGAGITLACGTGACAALVAGVLTGRCDRAVTVELPGGCLQVTWSDDNNRVYLMGPAERVFDGQWLVPA